MQPTCVNAAPNINKVYDISLYSCPYY